MTAPRRILVGADGSVHAAHALEWAAELAVALGAEVVAVHALGMLSHLGSPTTLLPAHEHREEVRALLETKWSEALRASGVTHRCLLVDGNPVMALMAVADEEDVDLVVVGTRGAGGFPGLQLGSTSYQLLQHTKRPVVVVPDD
ncbi:MAG: universal stress protein [Acidimicrobiales bacterium]|jgi:nucleotide-binding universal stress UspA family protein